MSYGSHAYIADPRNGSVLFNVNGALVPRDKAVVNVFDSGFMLGDGIWEGLRVHNGKIAFLQDHLDRLWEGAAALDLDIGLSQEDMSARIYETLAANDMTKDVHIRLMVTRGLRSTPYQDPRVVVSEATIVIAPQKPQRNRSRFILCRYGAAVRMSKIRDLIPIQRSIVSPPVSKPSKPGQMKA